MKFDQQQILTSALAVIDIEARNVAGLADRIDNNFATACQVILECKGRVIVTGLGKSGHIGGKIAATLASTGTPAFFVHAGEASHGDLGMIVATDVVLALSNSGETKEVLAIVPLIKRLNLSLIAMTGNAQSALATFADTHIDISVKQEACPLGLAPTSSTTATLVMGDALAVALLQNKGFTADDFALSHPGGSLGKRLLLRVNDIMHTKDAVPVVTTTASIGDALLEITNKKQGMTAIVDDQGLIAGIFTDGDLRRALERNCDIRHTSIIEVATKNCRVIAKNILAAEAMSIMEGNKINVLIIVDQQQRPIGSLSMYDLINAGVV